MTDFQFLHNPYSKQWTILAPRRSKRPDEAGSETTRPEKVACPFDIGNEHMDEEVYRIGGKAYDTNWRVRVLKNKYPFAPIHEVIVHGPSHDNNFDALTQGENQEILSVFRQRFIVHQKSGTVIIFHNHGERSGESLFHPHSQLVVIPAHVDVAVPALAPLDGKAAESEFFHIVCPPTSQWPDEVWIIPKETAKTFGEITDAELSDLAFALKRLIQILDMRHGNDFSYNFYISPWRHWYLRIIPRIKTIGGFELATTIFVNTQNPEETQNFIREHFHQPDTEKIKTLGRATYGKGV